MSTRFSSATTSQVWVPLNELDDDLQPLLDPDYGRAVKTNGFQSGLGSGAAITMSQGALSGGVTWSSANGGGLAVATAGEYSVSAYVYMSGTTGTAYIEVLRWRAGVSTTILRTYYIKGDGQDHGVTLAAGSPLAAGDIITLKITAPFSVWGDSSGVGTRFTVNRLA